MGNVVKVDFKEKRKIETVVQLHPAPKKKEVEIQDFDCRITCRIEDGMLYIETENLLVVGEAGEEITIKRGEHPDQGFASFWIFE